MRFSLQRTQNTLCVCVWVGVWFSKRCNLFKCVIKSNVDCCVSLSNDDICKLFRFVNRTKSVINRNRQQHFTWCRDKYCNSDRVMPCLDLRVSCALACTIHRARCTCENRRWCVTHHRTKHLLYAWNLNDFPSQRKIIIAIIHAIYGLLFMPFGSRKCRSYSKHRNWRYNSQCLCAQNTNVFLDKPNRNIYKQYTHVKAYFHRLPNGAIERLVLE